MKHASVPWDWSLTDVLTRNNLVKLFVRGENENRRLQFKARDVRIPPAGSWRHDGKGWGLASGSTPQTRHLHKLSVVMWIDWLAGRVEVLGKILLLNSAQIPHRLLWLNPGLHEVNAWSYGIGEAQSEVLIEVWWPWVTETLNINTQHIVRCMWKHDVNGNQTFGYPEVCEVKAVPLYATKALGEREYSSYSFRHRY
jgi:hypothetical protein